MHKPLALIAALSFITGCNCGPSQQPDGGSDAGPDAGLGCPQLNGLEQVHGNDVGVDETWAGDGTVHRITFGLTIRPGTTLTLAPCAVVRINPGLIVTVSGTPTQPSKLVSLGTADQPVLITAATPGQPWGALRSLSPDATFELAWTTLEQGGAGGTHGASLMLQAGANASTTVVPMLTADHLTIKGSAGTGLVMENGAAFTAASAELTVADGGSVTNGDSAIELTPLAAGTLPSLHVSGNARDQVRLAAGSLQIARDLTLKALGVPYYFVFDRVRVADPSGTATPTLTIQPGVEVRFDDYLVIGDASAGNPTRPGKLLATGTAAQPIVFTSSKATRAAGDWPGIWLRSASGSHLENARIEFAGGSNGVVSSNCKPNNSSDNAALFIGNFNLADQYVPAATDFASVSVVSSASHAINSMWTAASFGPDLTAGFVFPAPATIAGCRQTRNGLTAGGCGAKTCLVP